MKRKPSPKASAARQPQGFFSRLGLLGLESIEPVVLAALATEAPLLLIGSHGSGKSLLLERIAQALGLSWRHYNASLLNFDDLVGYPLPDAQGELRFMQTPASIWGAGVVLIDEISRARVDIQNRLFPIIHEKKVQGIALKDLRHRWAAMNPPTTDDSTDSAYAGSEALDVALADRFALHVRMPEWQAFDTPTQEAVILAHGHTPDAAVGLELACLLAKVQATLGVVDAQWARPIARYVRLLAGMLGVAGHTLSARRAGMLARNIVAVQAVRQGTDPHAEIADSAWLAALSSMPFAAAGILLTEGALLASHKEAWRGAAVQPDDPLVEILAERDPIRRVQKALAAPSLPEGELTTIITDALSVLPDGSRHALAEWLLEAGALPRLSVVAAECAGEVYRDIACLQEVHETVRPNSPRHRVWKHVEKRLAALDPRWPRSERKGNMLATLFSRQMVDTEGAVDTVLQAYDDSCARLLGLQLGRGAAVGH